VRRFNGLLLSKPVGPFPPPLSSFLSFHAERFPPWPLYRYSFTILKLFFYPFLGRGSYGFRESKVPPRTETYEVWTPPFSPPSEPPPFFSLAKLSSRRGSVFYLLVGPNHSHHTPIPPFSLLHSFFWPLLGGGLFNTFWSLPSRWAFLPPPFPHSVISHTWTLPLSLDRSNQFFQESSQSSGEFFFS